MIHKLRDSALFVIIPLLLLFVVYFISFIMDQSRLIDIIFMFWVPSVLIIALCDEVGYFNRKIILLALTAFLILASGLIRYSSSFSSVDKIQFYGISGFLTILIILPVLWMFRGWNKIEEAVKPYNVVLEGNPDDTTSLNNKGVELTHLKKYYWARDYFDKVLELDPGDSAALHNKGVVITKLKKTRKATEKANEYFDQALKLDPGFENAKHSGKMILET